MISLLVQIPFITILYKNNNENNNNKIKYNNNKNKGNNEKITKITKSNEIYINKLEMISILLEIIIIIIIIIIMLLQIQKILLL